MDLNELIKNPDQIKSLISILQELLPKENDSNTDIDNKFVSPIKTKISKKLSSDTRPNKFTDMPEMNMHKDDSRIDRLLNKNDPVARSRQFTTVNVTCRVCGKQEEIPASLATADSKTRYKCNTCSTSAG